MSRPKELIEKLRSKYIAEGRESEIKSDQDLAEEVIDIVERKEIIHRESYRQSLILIREILQKYSGLTLDENEKRIIAEFLMATDFKVQDEEFRHAFNKPNVKLKDLKNRPE